MDSNSKQAPGTAPAEYGNAGYGYGYPAHGYGESSAQRSLNDYLLILRERIWYVVVVFLVVFSSALVYTFSQTKIYESQASVQVLRQDARVMQSESVVDSTVRSTEDLNTLVKVLESSLIIKRVADRITGEELRQFMAPYEKGRWGDPLTPLEVLGYNRTITPLRLSLVVQVSYRHPDPVIAAKIANMFVDEFLQWNARVRIDESMRAVEDLQIRAEQQRKRVEEQANELQSYREKNDMVSLDQRKDIVTETLKQLNMLATQTQYQLKEAETRWQQVQQRQQNKGDLAELPFIAQNPIISQLTQQIAARKIEIAQMRERYRDRHPVMIQANNNLAQSERELERALASAASTIKAEYESALRNDQEARKQLDEASKDTLALDRLAVQYQAKEREFKINEEILAQLIARMREVNMQATMENSGARKVDPAVPSAANRYVEPRIALNIGVGVVGGLGLGLAFAFFVAFIDDRVKSSFDIESVVGLSLLGIIPQIKKMEQPDKAQIVVNNADRQVAEAFLTLHSSLRLRDDSKDAKVILTTSTIPGEGKSFTTTNLALTYAAHGDRVCVVDCDLRKPNIHKSFRRENLKGVIDVCSGAATLDDVVMKEVHPNLDVIPTGGRAKNPTQILNNKSFEIMISDLRKRYDRVFIDTPPLAAVSDALVVLPLVDGSIFTIFFNKVRRKAAQAAARRLLESNVTCYGAVLNGLNLAVSGYYYAQYYDKSYKDYYVVASPEEEAQMKDNKGEKTAA
ncbi:MAG: polysaccharide biosynthesis tyrosine autokinase [Opitutaceae bacterium]|jgi:capsular exopolysaccharide synthesis family protein|nr:polysaccharide biosynthesis tyrosine autokinase [Opitutaceae bacterium]